MVSRAGFEPANGTENRQVIDSTIRSITTICSTDEIIAQKAAQGQPRLSILKSLHLILNMSPFGQCQTIPSIPQSLPYLDLWAGSQALIPS